MEEKEIKAFLATAKDEEILDGLVEVLTETALALNPKTAVSSLEYAAGYACKQTAHAAALLGAYREKKYGTKGVTIL